MPKSTVKIIPDASSNVISYSGNYRIFSSDIPAKDVVKVFTIFDSVNLGNAAAQYLIRSFRYSLDRTSWSMWYEFVPDGSPAQGLDAIETVQMNPDLDLYIEYKYEYNDGSFDQLEIPITVNSISTVLETRSISAPIDLDSVVTSNCTSEFCPALVFERDATFNPYDVGNFVGLALETSMYVNKTFGIPALYFRTEPAKGGGDYVFKEWNLINVVERKCIKIVIPDNDFPDSKLHYNEFGVDYEVPFEIHVDKKYFETMFNPTAEVRKKDFMYIPMLNRMYEVQGSYMHRGLMMVPIYWKAQLVKFVPNINYLMKAEDTLFLDNLLLDTEETLSTIANRDIRDAVMPDQYKTISDRYNETRSVLNENLAIRQERFYFNYASLIDYYYDTATIPAGSVAVKYKYSGKFNSEQPNLTMSWMFNAKAASQTLNFLESNNSIVPTPPTGITVTGAITNNNLRVYVNINGQTKTYLFSGVQTGKWYSVILQMSFDFKQLGIFVYDPVEDISDSMNHNEFRLVGKHQDTLAGIEFNTAEGYQIRQSPCYIANVRIFDRMINFEDHSYMLSQLYVLDESMLLLIDNCRPKLNMPIVARAR